MLTLGGGARVYLALSPVDMRKGFDGLTALVQQVLRQDPFGGQLFLFRSRRGDRLKAVWWDGTGLCLFAKRIERRGFVWPSARRDLGVSTLNRVLRLDEYAVLVGQLSER